MGLRVHRPPASRRSSAPGGIRCGAGSSRGNCVRSSRWPLRPSRWATSCKVNGRHYLHLVKAIQGRRIQIGNNRGRVNGWVGESGIYGKCTRVE